MPNVNSKNLRACLYTPLMVQYASFPIFCSWLKIQVINIYYGKSKRYHLGSHRKSFFWVTGYNLILLNLGKTLNNTDIRICLVNISIHA